MAELLDREVALADVFPMFGEELNKQIQAAPDTAARVAISDDALRHALADNRVRDEPIRSLNKVVAGGAASGRDIASSLGVSERTLRRLWHQVVGLEHRKFVSLMRFHRALGMVDAGEELSFVAAECGYADQPHLARDFKNIAGLPASLLRKRLGADVYRDLYANRPAAPWKEA